MELDPRFAQTLVDIVAAELNQNVNITDNHGVIIASFSKERISHIHEAAAKMLLSGPIREFSVTDKEERQLKGVRAGFNVPIMVNDCCVGVIGVSGEPHTAAPYTRLAARFVEAALESNARQEKLVRALLEKEELQSTLLNKVISVQEEERKKISRELHDETSQALTSIIVGLRVLSEHVHSENERMKILEMRDLVVTTLEAVHHLAVQLRPALLDDLGLVAAAQKYIENYSRQYNIFVDLAVVNLSRQRFLPEIEITLYRILQEALTNIAKHAKASKVKVTLKKHKGRLMLIVKDSGIGFNAKRISGTASDNCLGIHGMHERVALLSGDFTIHSSEGEGTTIAVEIPIRQHKKTESGLGQAH
ncbi:sugar diacid recognition domain-containing protein [Sporomusa sphaeroides]|uniref:histidine kinase n=1 Tax=Sporomusa sphaeroides DSM 2875 TaxID=1337886 RepID=A0ABM9VZ50_9FIRM|nr:sugar diacid recognition domain-containing protein [Sporomusa sphaeroides]CVK17866.1 Oxygen sensor histidine kinase NreB [Sporomusa sphaeroides DSM 2875]